jgi:hypothetical protein
MKKFGGWNYINRITGGIIPIVKRKLGYQASENSMGKTQGVK